MVKCPAAHSHPLSARLLSASQIKKSRHFQFTSKCGLVYLRKQKFYAPIVLVLFSQNAFHKIVLKIISNYRVVYNYAKYYIPLIIA